MENLNFIYILLPGCGSHNSAYKESNAVLIERAGDHSSFKMSKQIAPV